jgi:hypothetical protein
MSDMQITVRIANNYGGKVIYPVCDLAKFFTRISGRKTMTFDVIDAIKEYGYRVVVEAVAEREL